VTKTSTMGDAWKTCRCIVLGVCVCGGGRGGGGGSGGKSKEENYGTKYITLTLNMCAHINAHIHHSQF